MEVLHLSTARHLKTKRMLAMFRKPCPAAQDWKLAKHIVHHCDGCQMGQDYRHLPVPWGAISVPHPWYTVNIDITGPFPTAKGERFIASYIDIFSRYVALATATDHTTSTMAHHLMNDIMAYFGVPPAILSN